MVPILAELAMTDIRAMVKRKRRNAIFLAVASLFGLTAYVALVAWAGLSMAAVYGPQAAALAVAGTATGLALCIIAGVAIVSHYERRNARHRSGSATLALAAGLAVLPSLGKSRLLTIGMAAAGLALLAARTSDADGRDD